MGCGASTAKTGVDPEKAENAAAKQSQLTNKESKRIPAQLKKVNSQLGTKSIVNSFVVQKTRNRRRESENGPEGSKPERPKNVTEREALSQIDEEPINQDPDKAFQLPAEMSAVAEPALKGVSNSGPSFKMARGSQAKLLSELNTNQLSDVGEYKPKLYSSKDEDILEAVQYFRERLSVVNPPVAAIRQTGIAPRLVELLKRDDHRKLQYEVAWTLTNICSSEHEDCQDVADQGAVPEFVRLLGSCDDQNVLEQALWALGNIAADCKELQKAVLDEAVVQPLLGAVRRHMGQMSLLKHAAWLLSNLCRPKPQSEELYGCVPVLADVLEGIEDPEVLAHACWALAYITGDGDDPLQELLEHSSVLPKLVQWVAEGTHSVTTPALRVLGNMCSSSEACTQAVVDGGGVAAMLSCLRTCNRTSLKKEVVWSLSNIAAGTSDQVKALVSSGVFPAIMELMHGSEESIRRECTYVLANPWAATVDMELEVAQGMIKDGVVQELVSLLDVSTPSSILVVVVEGLQDALKKGQKMMMQMAKLAAAAPPPPPPAEGAEGGAAEAPAPPAAINPVAEIMKSMSALDKIAALQSHPDDSVHAKANGITNMLQFM